MTSEPDTLKHHIQAKYDSLSETEKKVAKFVIDHYQQSMLLSSVELAQMAKVSDTAVIRFAKALGFKGYLEYKKRLKAEYTSSQKVYSSLSLMDADSEGSYISNYLTNLEHDIHRFIYQIDQRTLDKICSLIQNAQIVYLVGLGCDIVVSRFLQNYLKVMGVKCIPINEEGLSLRENMFLISENDLVIMSSFPTLLKDEEWIGAYCTEKGTPLIALTDSEITARALGTKYHVRISESADTFFNSYVIPMVFCNVLLLRLYEKDAGKTTEAMKAYQEMMKR